MKIKRIIMLMLIIITLILEILPNGAALNFANPEGEAWRRTYSYFSLTPFGYANFAPLITALFTVILIILSLINWLKKSKISASFKIISGFALFTSLLPMLYGIEYITATGALISILLLINFILSLAKSRTNKEGSLD